MQQAERDQVQELLTQSREFLRRTVAGLTPEQRSFRPASDRWSIAECVEHAVIVEKGVFDGIQKVLEAPPPADQQTSQEKDRFILDQVPKRSTAIQAPSRLVPTGRWPDADELLGAFEAARERTLEFASTTSADLRAYSFLHPVLGPLDCYQWLLAIAAHCERHVHQMAEIKANPAFPGKAGSAEA